MTTLLIDGDSVAFKAACAHQETIDWGEGEISVSTNPKGAEDHMVSALNSYRDVLEADTMIICLGGGDYWRTKLWSQYKANRKNKSRPELLPHCLQFLREKYTVEAWPRLEADDVMGILSASIKDSVIVSIDKDMKTVPGRLFNPDHPEDGVRDITEEDAFHAHMLQALTGDTADGYKGCPGIGPKKAGKILDEVIENTDFNTTFKREKEMLWEAVVKTYEAKGLTPDDALLNARLAYILQRPNEYNRKTRKMKLWQPPI